MREIQIDKFFGDHPHLQAFGEALLHQDMATSTIRSYGYDLVEFFRWMTAARGDSTGPDEIEGIDIYRYRDYLLDERRLSTATINRRLESLRRFCRWAHQEKILKIDPTVEMRPGQLPTLPNGPNAELWRSRRHTPTTGGLVSDR